MSIYFPGDIVKQLALHLPFNKVLEFKRVCHNWYRLFDETNLFWNTFARVNFRFEGDFRRCKRRYLLEKLIFNIKDAKEITILDYPLNSKIYSIWIKDTFFEFNDNTLSKHKPYMKVELEKPLSDPQIIQLTDELFLLISSQSYKTYQGLLGYGDFFEVRSVSDLSIKKREEGGIFQILFLKEGFVWHKFIDSTFKAYFFNYSNLEVCEKIEGHFLGVHLSPPSTFISSTKEFKMDGTSKSASKTIKPLQHQDDLSWLVEDERGNMFYFDFQLNEYKPLDPHFRKLAFNGKKTLIKNIRCPSKEKIGILNQKGEINWISELEGFETRTKIRCEGNFAIFFYDFKLKPIRIFDLEREIEIKGPEIPFKSRLDNVVDNIIALKAKTKTQEIIYFIDCKNGKLLKNIAFSVNPLNLITYHLKQSGFFKSSKRWLPLKDEVFHPPSHIIKKFEL